MIPTPVGDGLGRYRFGHLRPVFLAFSAKSCPHGASQKEGITMRNAIGHVRVSSEDQADSGLGLEAQRQRIRA
jgi:hypothetical protein